MGKVAVVTSCSTEGWQQYGLRFAMSFNTHWPEGVDLHIVSEDDFELKLMPGEAKRKMMLWPLVDHHIEAAKFLDRHKEHGWVHGDASDPARPTGLARHWRPNAGKHCFRHDAYKFCKKVFAIHLIAEFLKEGRLFWIDADVATFAAVPDGLAERMLPEAYALSCLARQGYHSECGFVGYNLDNPATMKFIRAFSALYHTDEVFSLAEWHDSWVFDWLRNKLMTSTFDIPHKSKSHPFIHSELGRYMDHYKGMRKKYGRTPAGEQTLHRDIAYWRA